MGVRLWLREWGSEGMGCGVVGNGDRECGVVLWVYGEDRW